MIIQKHLLGLAVPGRWQVCSLNLVPMFCQNEYSEMLLFKINVYLMRS